MYSTLIVCKNYICQIFLASYISEQNENLRRPMLKLRNPTLHSIANPLLWNGMLQAPAWVRSLLLRELRSDKDEMFWATRGKRSPAPEDFWAIRGKKQSIKPNGFFQTLKSTRQDHNLQLNGSTKYIPQFAPTQ